MASEPDVEADDDPRPLQPGTNVNGVKVVRFVDASQEYSAPKEYFLDGADSDGLYDQDNHSGRKGLPEDAVSLGSYGWSADGVQVPFEDAGTRGRQIRHEKAVRFLSTVLLDGSRVRINPKPVVRRSPLDLAAGDIASAVGLPPAAVADQVDLLFPDSNLPPGLESIDDSDTSVLDAFCPITPVSTSSGGKVAQRAVSDAAVLRSATDSSSSTAMPAASRVRTTDDSSTVLNPLPLAPTTRTTQVNQRIRRWTRLFGREHRKRLASHFLSNISLGEPPAGTVTAESSHNISTPAASLDTNLERLLSQDNAGVESPGPAQIAPLPADAMSAGAGSEHPGAAALTGSAGVSTDSAASANPLADLRDNDGTLMSMSTPFAPQASLHSIFSNYAPAAALSPLLGDGDPIEDRESAILYPVPMTLAQFRLRAAHLASLPSNRAVPPALSTAATYINAHPQNFTQRSASLMSFAAALFRSPSTCWSYPSAAPAVMHSTHASVNMSTVAAVVSKPSPALMPMSNMPALVPAPLTDLPHSASIAPPEESGGGTDSPADALVPDPNSTTATAAAGVSGSGASGEDSKEKENALPDKRAPADMSHEADDTGSTGTSRGRAAALISKREEQLLVLPPPLARQASTTRQWEAAALHNGVLNSRVFLCTRLGSMPLMVSSVLSYRPSSGKSEQITPVQRREALPHGMESPNTDVAKEQGDRDAGWEEKDGDRERERRKRERERERERPPAAPAATLGDDFLPEDDDDDGGANAKRKEHSYRFLLSDSKEHSVADPDDRDSEPDQPQSVFFSAPHEPDRADDTYDPYLLEDVSLGKHRLVMNLHGMMSSILSFVKASDVKQELNNQFREKHPWLHPSMSLSKIRRIKRLMTTVGRELDIELSTIALAYVYFEKLVIKNVVDKENRKVAAAGCVLLAFKMNELMTPQQMKTHRVPLARLLEELENVFGVTKKDLLHAEFGLFVCLGFNLAVHPDQVMPHFNTILASVELVSQDYLGTTNHWSSQPLISQT